MGDGLECPTRCNLSRQNLNVIGLCSHTIERRQGYSHTGVFADDQGLGRGRPVNHAASAGLVRHHHNACDVTIMQHRVSYQMNHTERQPMPVL